MNRLNNALNSIFKFFPTILIRDFRVSNRSSRYYRLFNRCWITAALFTPVLSTLLLTFLNEKTYIVTVFALLSNILTWPLFFSYIFKKLIVFMKQLKIEVESDPSKKKEVTLSIEAISEEYCRYLELTPFASKIVFLAFSFLILLFVFSKLPPLFTTSWLNTVSKYVFIIHTLIGAYGAAGLLSTIICIDRLVKNQNIYETYQHPKYAKLTCDIRALNSFITYSVIVMYFAIWVAIWGNSISPSDFLLLFIMSCIGLFPLAYTIYSIRIQQTIISYAKRRELDAFEGSKLKNLHRKLINDDYSNRDELLSDVSLYRELIDHRNLLAKEDSFSHKELYLNLIIPIIIAIITAVAPTVLQLLSK